MGHAFRGEFDIVILFIVFSCLRNVTLVCVNQDLQLLTTPLLFVANVFFCVTHNVYCKTKHSHALCDKTLCVL